MTVATITDNTTGTYTGVEDCEIDVSTPTTNLGSASPMTSSAFSDEKSLIKFSGLSNIPSNAIVSDVTVRLYIAVAPSAGNTIFSRVLRNWVENQATWNIYSTGNNWGTAGAAAGTDTAASSATISHGTSTGYVSLTAAGLITDVQNWINGTNPNYGWLLTDSAGYLEVVSSEGTDGQRPELIVTFSTATLEQEAYRWGVDDGSESAHTWEAAQDTSITLPDTQSRLVRVLVNATDDPSALPHTLRYQKNGTGGFAAVPVGSGTPEMTGAPAYSALGAGANVTTSSGSLNVSYPSMTGATTATALYLVVTGRHSTANTAETVPSGWTLVESLEGGTGTYGADAGTRRVAVYRKDSVTGSESGTIAVSFGGTTSSTTYGSIVRVDSPGAGYFLTQSSADGADTSAGTAVSIAASASLSYVVDDLILVCHASPSDTGGVVNSPTLTATGQTFGSLTSRASIAVTGGNDHRHVIYSAVVTAAGADSAPTFAYTASGTNSGNASGPAVFVRIRATKAAVNNEVYVETSSNITAGGEATTARLTAPSGKTTSDFVTGRRWDDENSETGDAIDITTDDYTEVEWLVALSAAPSNGDYYDFRVYAGSTALDTYTQTPRWTVGTAGPTTSFVYLRSIAPLLLH